MKKIFLLLLVAISSCTSTKSKNANVAVSALDADFPVTDSCKFGATLQQTFNIYDEFQSFIVKDSTMLAFLYGDKETFGYCFNINNGEKLFPIISRGKAANEILELYGMVGSNNNLPSDSIQFFAFAENKIKTFAVNDIITKPLGDRPFSVSTLSDTCTSFSSIKLDDATIFGTFNGSDPDNIHKYFTFDGKNLSFFGEFNDGLYQDEEKIDYPQRRLLIETLLTNRGDKIVAAECNGILLQVVDAKKQTIDYKRYYTPIVVDASSNPGLRTRNEYRTKVVRCDDKMIYCLVVKERDPVTRMALADQACYIFTFDWELKPIKKYYIGTFSKNNKYYLSENGDVVYRLINNENTHELHKYDYSKQ